MGNEFNEDGSINTPYVINKSKNDSYCYVYHLANGLKLYVQDCDGPAEQGGEYWYDLSLHDPVYERVNKQESPSRLRVSVNARHIVMVTELES